MKRLSLLLATLLLAQVVVAAPPAARLKTLRQPVVVLSFDDATVGLRTNVAPLLQKYHFGATFYVCEFAGFEDKTKYMTWQQIRELNDMGFEIGNHSWHHGAMAQQTIEQVETETRYIEDQCGRYGIPRPVTYAYAGYSNTPEGRALLATFGYRLARHGGDKYFVPHQSDKMLFPSFGITDSNYSAESIRKILDGVKKGEVVVFCLHGVPDLAHDFVSLSPANFEAMLEVIHSYGFKVVAMRDLLQYDL